MRKYQAAANHLLKDEIQRASKVLKSTEPATLDEERRTALKRLYPVEDKTPVISRLGRTTDKIKFSKDELHATLLKMSRHKSAPGPSGHTARNLLDFASIPNVLEALTILGNELVSGRLNGDPTFHRLNHARGIALSKPNNGVRPIGVNEAFINAVSRIVLER